jgi:tryptophanyl-tRNA synthetase
MYGHLKADVADAVVTMLAPIQTKYNQYRNDQQFLNEVMRGGAAKASLRASKILSSVYDAVGFIPHP